MNIIKHNRSPIIAIVGHIDHGKSMLQQALRNLDKKLDEAGGITQHIGAYEVHTKYEGNDRRCTIIDTPGHAAFSHIREHSLELADIALLIVSSEEGFKDQTKEAYEAIKKRGIPFIVVFTKTDTPKSDLETAKMSVLQGEIYLEGLGGDIPWISVSSVTKNGIQDLLDLIFLTTDVYEITKNKEDKSVGVLVEVDIDKRVGIAGTVIVLDKSLEEKKFITVGTSISPLRIIENDKGVKLKKVIPSTPVRIIGFDSIPPIGKPVFLHDSKKDAAQWIKENHKELVEKQIVDVAETEYAIPLIIRSDTASGIQSIITTIKNTVPSGISFKIIKSSVGTVTEEDVRLILAETNGVVVGFHTKIDASAKQLSEKKPSSLLIFNTIYEIMNWAKKLSQKEKKDYQLRNKTGTAKVIRKFEEDPSKGLYIMGLQITEGTFQLNQSISVTHGNSTTGTFKITNIEQKNKSVESVAGVKTQFAAKVEGEGSIALDDIVEGLPIM